MSIAINCQVSLLVSLFSSTDDPLILTIFSSSYPTFFFFIRSEVFNCYFYIIQKQFDLMRINHFEDKMKKKRISNDISLRIKVYLLMVNNKCLGLQAFLNQKTEWLRLICSWSQIRISKMKEIIGENEAKKTTNKLKKKKVFPFLSFLSFFFFSYQLQNDN